MAFHDGWIHPHKLGPVIVLLLAVLSVAVPYPLIKQQLESGDTHDDDKPDDNEWPQVIA